MLLLSDPGRDVYIVLCCLICLVLRRSAGGHPGRHPFKYQQAGHCHSSAVLLPVRVRCRSASGHPERLPCTQVIPQRHCQHSDVLCCLLVLACQKA
jgi:hypothetical protein